MTLAQWPNVDVSVAEPVMRLSSVANGDPLQALTWDDFKGQAKAKEELRLQIQSARTRDMPLPNVMLSAPPGLGKTTLAHIIANSMGVRLIACSAQDGDFKIFDMIRRASDKDVVFLDEIHSMARRRGTVDFLLPILTQWRTADGYLLPKVTFIGATTDADKLPESFLSRFPVAPYFEPYTIAEMRDIVISMSSRIGISLEPKTIHYLAKASGGVPRAAGRLVAYARVLVDDKQDPTPEAVLALAGMTPDGLTRLHREYLAVVLRNPRTVQGRPTYRMGFSNICTVMHQPKETVVRLERLLIDRGYITLQPGGRELTEKGIREAGK